MAFERAQGQAHRAVITRRTGDRNRAHAPTRINLKFGPQLGLAGYALHAAGQQLGQLLARRRTGGSTRDHGRMGRERRRQQGQSQGGRRGVGDGVGKGGTRMD